MMNVAHTHLCSMNTKHSFFSTRCNNPRCNDKHQFDLGGGGADLVVVGEKVALLPIPLETAEFLVHHIHAFTIHVTILILLKEMLLTSRQGPKKILVNLHMREGVEK